MSSQHLAELTVLCFPLASYFTLVVYIYIYGNAALSIHNSHYFSLTAPTSLFSTKAVVRRHEAGGNALTVGVLSGPRASSILVKGVLTFSPLIQYWTSFFFNFLFGNNGVGEDS